MPRKSSARPKEQSLAELKRQVFDLAKVSNTKQLKATNADLMAEWERNPPDEYKELFAEIEQATAAYSASIEQGLKLSSQLREAADDLEAVAEELQQEAGELKAIEQASAQQRRARSLN